MGPHLENSVSVMIHLHGLNNKCNFEFEGGCRSLSAICCCMASSIFSFRCFFSSSLFCVFAFFGIAGHWKFLSCALILIFGFEHRTEENEQTDQNRRRNIPAWRRFARSAGTSGLWWALFDVSMLFLYKALCLCRILCSLSARRDKPIGRRLARIRFARIMSCGLSRQPQLRAANQF